MILKKFLPNNSKVKDANENKGNKIPTKSIRRHTSINQHTPRSTMSPSPIQDTNPLNDVSRSESLKDFSSYKHDKGSSINHTHPHHYHHYHSDLDNNISLKDNKNNTELPFGDGSNKVFGYENFGNTCYCNSVLQCLFYLDPFRINILTYPLSKNNIHAIIRSSTPTNKDLKISGSNSRHRKRVMNGSTKRYFTKESFQPGMKDKDNPEEDQNLKIPQAKTPTVKNNISDNLIEQPQRKNSPFSPFMRRSGAYSRTPEPFKTTGSRNNMSSTSSHEINKVEPIHTIVMAADCNTERLHDGCERIIVGRKDCITEASSNNNSSTSSKSQSHGSTSPLLLNMAKFPSELSLSSKHMGSFDNINDQHVRDNMEPSNINLLDNSFTSDKRKKSALISGPILNIDYMVNVTTKPNIYNGLKDIFECITENDRLTGVVSPLQFIHILKRENVLFNTSSQQDAHEFLNFVLNDLNDYLQTFNTNSKSTYIPPEIRNFILDQFQGIVKNSSRCLTCDTTTSNNEPFLDLSIEMPSEKDLNQDINIQEFLNDYKQREFLKGANKFYCNQCYSLQEAERLVTISDLPPILALHLKRFKYSEDLNENIKLFNRVYYPLILDVSSNVNTECTVHKRYELTSVVIHMGNSPRHGHYVSLCKSSLYGWLLFDDETVESVSETTVLRFIGNSSDQTTAYVLFYKELQENGETTTDKEEDKEDVISFSDITPKNKDEYERNIDHLLDSDDHLKEMINQRAQRQAHLNNNVEIDSIKNSSNSIISLRNKASGAKKEPDKSKRRSRLMTFIRK